MHCIKKETKVYSRQALRQKMKPNLIIDFDSTISKVEALEELAKIRMRRSGNMQLLQQISEITNQAMAGEIPFNIALRNRILLLQFNKIELAELIGVLIARISSSFVKNFSTLKENAASIHIISGGFVEFIEPTLENKGIEVDSILANKFVFNKEGACIGVNEANALSHDKGKIKASKSLRLNPKKTIVIGDGFTDFHIKEAGLANTFIAYTQHVERESVVKVADYVAQNFDEVLTFLKFS